MVLKRKSRKPKNILELEEKLDIEFIEVSIENVQYFSSGKRMPSYTVNSEGEVIGLKMNSINLTDLSFVSEFSNLNILNLYDNGIKNIHALGLLKDLKILDLSYNKIQNYGLLSSLKGLTKLDLASNNVKDISFLRELKNLEILILTHNKIHDLTPISRLEKLTYLDLSTNKIEDAIPLSQLKGIRTMYLTSNSISEVSFLKGLNSLIEVYLHSNPIKGIPISDLNDINAIKGYLETLEADSTEILEENYHVKVNIVGSGNIGKTQLFNWFTNKDFEEERVVTHGTNVNTYKVKNGQGKPTEYRASLWDFGGQSYQHGTHSLFLRPQDFYLVLFRSEEDSHNYGYWLGAARSFALKTEGGNYGSPLFLIQSVWSEKSDDLIHPEKRKMDTYKVAPDHFISLDVKKCFGDGNDKWTYKKQYFQKVLYDEIVKHARSFGQIPKEFIKKRGYIERRKKPYITKTEFVEKYAVGYSEEKLAYFLQYLEFAGAIVYFREKEFLNQFVFVNPQELSNWIYKTVLDETFLEKGNGVLDYEKLQEDSGEEEAKIFKSLMLTFNLLFEEPIQDGEEQNQNLVIPQFLPENDHSLKRVLLELIPFTFSIRFEDFIYEGRIFNFISEYGKYAEDNSSYWKYGILFHKDGVKSVVYYDIKKRIIHVHLQNKKESVKLSKEILDYFILKSELRDSESDEMRDKKGMRIKGSRIPSRNLEPENIIIGAQLSTNEENYVDIIETLKLKEESIKTGTCALTYKPILLDVLTLKLLEMEDKRLKRVFISYSRKDMQYKDELKSHLSLLNRYDLVKAWTCDEIKSGKWHKQIQKELEEADIIIYMVSHHFLDSDYIMEKEVQKGIQLVENDPQKKILCVLVGSCQWKNLPELEKINNSAKDQKGNYSNMDLTKYQFLPYHQYKNNEGTPVREEIVPLEKWGRHPYDVPNEAYNQIAERILKEIR